MVAEHSSQYNEMKRDFGLPISRKDYPGPYPLDGPEVLTPKDAQKEKYQDTIGAQIANWIYRAHTTSAQQQDRIRWERQCAMVRAFLDGRATRYVNEETGMWEDLDPEINGNIRGLQLNLVRAMHRTLRSIMTQARPDVLITPTSTDYDRETAARMLPAWLKWNAVQTGLEIQNHDFFRYAIETGLAYWFVFWDNNQGPEAGPVLSRTGKLGEVVARTEDPFCVFPEYSARSFDETRYLIIARIRDSDYVEQRYEIDLHAEERLTYKPSEHYIATHSLGGEDFSPEQRFQNELPRDAVIVYDVWFRPCRRYPTGRHIISTDTMVLRDSLTDMKPYGGMFPYVAYYPDRPSGRYYPRPLLIDSVHINRVINATLRRVIHHVHGRASNVLLVPHEGVNLDFRDTGVSDTQIVVYDKSIVNPGDLHIVSNNPLPPDIYALIPKLEELMMRVLGVTDTLLGEMPSQRISGIALGRLQDVSLSKLNPDMDLAEQAFAQRDALRLRLAASMYKEDRFVLLHGEGMEPVIRVLKKERIPQEFVVQVVPGSSRPMTRTQEMAELLELGRAGLLSPETIQHRLRRIDIGPPTEEERASQKQDNEVWQMLETSKFVPPAYYDNHDAESRYLRQYMRSADFASLPTEKQALIMLHDQMHMQYLQKADQLSTQALAVSEPGESIGSDIGSSASAALPEMARAG